MDKTRRSANNNNKKQLADKPLTILQQAALNAVISGQAKTLTDACRIAGYKGSDTALSVQAGRLLRNAKFKSAIDQKRAELAEKAGIKAETVINEIASLALKKCNKKAMFRYSDKLDALDKLCKHLGLYKADTSSAGNVADIFAVVLNNIAGNRQVNAIDSVASPTRHKQPVTHADIPMQGSLSAVASARPIVDDSGSIQDEQACLNSQDGDRGGAVDENVER